MKKTKIISVLVLLCSISIYSQDKKAELEWFSGAKMGMFLHWGLYSHAAGEWKGKKTKGNEHFMLYERIPLKEYGLIGNDFNPTGFNAEKWVKTAKNAGMKYIVITAKHHDGFAMYDSKTSDYNIVKKTKFARDPIKELAAACKKEGIKLGLYYSLGRDWEDPDVPTNWPTKAGRSNTWDYPNEDSKNLSAYIERKVKPQLKELLTNYGDIAMIWFDTPELVTQKQSQEIKELIEMLQPKCLVNSRVGNNLGDYDIIEQQLMDTIKHRPWEACLTMGKNWGYNKFDTIYKSPEVIIRNFVDIISKGGNMLLNVGPTGEGLFPKQTDAEFSAFHNWIKINAEAVYNTYPWKVYGESFNEQPKKKEKKEEFHDLVFDDTPKDTNPDIRFTAKENIVYVFARSIKEDNFTIKSFAKNDKIKSITLLGNNKKIIWKFSENGLNIKMPSLNKSGLPIYVFKIEFKN
ncbi:Alpha-L-fucosidase [compost metagenome]